MNDWDPDVGLWWAPGPGHTPETRSLKRVHPGRLAAWKLTAAAVGGSLSELDVSRILRNLRAMQETEGAGRGSFRWYWEESRPFDSNASFFTVLGLLVFHFEAGSALSADNHALLCALLADSRPWFERECAALSKNLRYPNKTLGDLICAWLLQEALGDDPMPLSESLHRAADYYHKEHWGWGEHLSDTYAKVLQLELIALLLYGKRLPPPLRASYERLLRALIHLDALFAGGPRVPAIRSYHFLESPQNAGAVRPLLASIAAASRECTDGLFGPLLLLAHRAGFHGRYADCSLPEPFPTIPCFGGAVAQAIVKKPFRLGVLSRYPLMEGIEHPTWGLVWQSMPMAYWNVAGDWAYLQWETVSPNGRRTHPAESFHHGGHVQLSESVHPPLVGETYGRRIHDSLIAFRRLGGWAPEWQQVAERFRLVGGSSTATVEGVEGPWRTLTLLYRDHSLQIACYPLVSNVVFETSQPNKGHLDWTIRFFRTPDSSRVPFSLVWIWQAGNTLAPLPTLERTDGTIRLRFRQKGATLVCGIVPEAPHPEWESRRE